MKFAVLALLCLLALAPCRADEYSELLDKSAKLGGAEQARINALDASPFKVEIKEDDSHQNYSRQGKLILMQSRKYPDVYTLVGPDGKFGSVVTNKDTSPRIIIDPQCPVYVVIEFLSKKAMLIYVRGQKSDFMEGYLVTKKFVRPLDEKEYLKQLAEDKGDDKFYDTLFEPLKALIGPDKEKQGAATQPSKSE